MRIFSFSGLRIVRLRPRWPLMPGANRLVHGRLRRFHPSAQPRACGCPRSASFSGPGALRMRSEQCPENISGNISGNMSEDMSGTLSGALPERASRRSPGWLRKEARTALREVLQTAFSASSGPGFRGPGPAAALARDGRSPFYSVAGEHFFCYSNNGIRNISVNLSRNKSAKERFQ